MEFLYGNGTGNGSRIDDQTRNTRDLYTQSGISVALGLSAFIAFCILRPRWTTLYAARKRQKSSASMLPELPDTFFGWLPVLYRITEEQVLASAGLDAFVFLAFFKMAIKFLAIIFFFSITIIYPIHTHFNIDNPPDSGKDRDDKDDALTRRFETLKEGGKSANHFMWVYVVFVYLFSGIAMYMIITETKRVIQIRQKYLGSKSSVTDRTIRLSGIPEHLRSEETIKKTIESLEIGKVESVVLCKNWKELDGLINERMSVLRKLEESWTVHLGARRVERNLETLPIVQPSPPGPGADSGNDDEQDELLNSQRLGQPHVAPYACERPTTRMWFGFLNLRSRKIDAIDYYEEHLRRLDDKIKAAREKEYSPTALAFVTMDSIAACQMAVQAILDPEPMQLLANLAPAPADVIWKNTYLPRRQRMTRAWSITFAILILTVFWSLLLVPLAGLLNLDSIGKVLPQLAEALSRHETVRTLVQTGLPTLAISILNVLVPYIYYWLSTLQGFVSQGEIEMSLISKNFFFTFFNLFVVFTIFGTVSNAYQLYKEIGESLKDTTRIAFILAQSLERLGPFYMNFIVLQGLGLFPLRLLEFGSVSLYPINLIGAKTPRDYAELVQPPIFSYGFYLPQTILIFIICIVYSVLPKSELINLFGLIYFIIGILVYKYQLLYAMDHRQHSTGRAWTLICNRFVVAILVFQVAMTGQLAAKGAFKRSLLVLPLLIGTIWFSYFFRRTFEPLMKYIALRSLQNDSSECVDSVPPGESRRDSETNHRRAADEDERKGLRLTGLKVFVTTSSQILLSRGVAGANSEPSSPLLTSAAPLISIFENDSVQVATIGLPDRSIGIRYAPSSTHSAIDLERSLPIKSFKEIQPPSDPTTVQHLMQIARRNLSSSHGHPPALTGRSSRELSTEMALTNTPGGLPSVLLRNPTLLSPHPTLAASSEIRPNFEDESLRGRVLTSFSNISRSSIRRRQGPSSINFEEELIQHRFSNTENESGSLTVHDAVIEPLPERSTSLSQIFTRSVTREVTINLKTFRGHRDTFALLDLPSQPQQAPDLPFHVFKRLARFLDFDSYLAVRRSCRCWSVGITLVRQPKFPSVYYLPMEILQMIYSHLLPADFNAARHTSRAWMLSSLDKRLLELMLKKGGWWGCVQADMNDDGDQDLEKADINKEWVMSKRLSTECSLGPDWTDNCTRSSRTQQGPRNEDKSTKSALVLTAKTDFSELTEGYGNSQGSALHFTASVCGKFALVADGCVIYVYRLSNNKASKITYGGRLEPLTSIICPRRVLAISMDTSSNRFAVAALLDDRMGIVCDLVAAKAGGYSNPRSRSRSWDGPDFRASDTRNISSNNQASPENFFSHNTNLTHAHFGSSTLEEGGSEVSKKAATASLPEQTGRRSSDASIPIETGPRNIYRSLCSTSDPPLSVAICPQRRCVAFGCSGGIELHWVDALTGQDLNRWFPLTAPSDYLYFLPPRRGIDSAKKLRLISSAGFPGQNGRLRGRYAPGNCGWYFLNHQAWAEGEERSRTESDHYRAVPLSDGAHLLFTDPVTGALCLGSDAPRGGPTKLIRKIVFSGPQTDNEMVVPNVYAAGQELRWGVRVAVGYLNAIWLFCLPPDILNSEDGQQEYVWEEVHRDANKNPRADSKPWPLHLQGAEVGYVEGLLDLAVDTSFGSVTIWGFGADGMVHTWQVDNGSTRECERRIVLRDGRVIDHEDADGDTVMRDAPPSHVPIPTIRNQHFEFDGAGSRTSSTLHENSSFPPHVQSGDVHEVDFGGETDEGYWSDEVDEVDGGYATGAFALHIPPTDGRWSEESMDWSPEILHLENEGGASQGMNLYERSRLECEIL